MNLDGQLFKILVSTFIILPLFWWLIRPRKSKLIDPNSGEVSMVSSIGIRVAGVFIGLLCLLFLAIGIVLMAIPDGPEWWKAIPIILPGFLLLIWVWRIFSFRVTANSDGFAYRSTFRKINCSWSEVESVKWNEQSQHLQFKTPRGSFDLSPMLDGFPGFAELAVKNCSSATFVLRRFME